MEAKDLLMAFVQVVNETTGNLPVGCIGKSNREGVYNARSVADVPNFSIDIDALDGFISDGLCVQKLEQRKAGKDDNFHGWIVRFALAGRYNGIVRVFTRTELECKMYLHRDMWKIVTKEVKWVPVEDEGEAFTRLYDEPQMMDHMINEFRAMDKAHRVANKVGMAMKGRLKDYDAFLDEMIFDRRKCEFVVNEESK